jgi:hypothetical protein
MNTRLDNLTILENILGDHDGHDRNNNYVFTCTNCQHPKPHLVIDVVTEKYHCWICDIGGQGLKRMLFKLGFASEAKRFFSSNITYGSPTNLNDLITMLSHSPQKKPLFDKLFIPKEYENLYKHKKGFGFGAGVNYLYGRGITQDDLIKYNMHYSPTSRRILIPSYDPLYKINYFITRSIDDEVNQTYDNPPIPKTNFIFNEHLIDWNKPLFLVEGVFDAIMLRRNAVPILGSSLKRDHKLFRKILNNNSKIVLCLDPDAYNKQITIANILVKNGIDVKMIDLRKFDNDIGSIKDVEIVNELINNNSVDFDFLERVASNF